VLNFIATDLSCTKYSRLRESHFLGHSVDNYSYSGKVGGVMLSFVLSVTSVTYNCRNGRRPNMVGMGKG